MSPSKSSPCRTLKWLRHLAVVPGPRPRRRQRDIPPRPVLSLCRVLPLSISLCHSATNGENMRCSPRGRRARERAAVTPVHVQLGPAPYCFFRASEREKGLTYEPRSMHGVKRRRQPAGHLCPGPVIFGNTNAQKCSVVGMYFSINTCRILLRAWGT